MALHISRREVLNNLIGFKDSLLDNNQVRGSKGDRKYKVLLNRKSGVMRFAQKISALEHHIARKGSKKERAEDWKEIQIIVHQASQGEAVQFEVRDAHNHSLKPQELDPLAWRVASETIEVLNLKAEEVKGQMPEMLPEAAVLKDLSSIQISQAKDRLEDMPGWKGSLSRIDAEKVLDGKVPGTYIFREGDELTISISFHFEQENHLHIHPYLITVVEDEGKISDILLLQTTKGWILYDDDPNLNDLLLYDYYPSPQAVLDHIKDVAKLPLPVNRSS